MASRVFTYIKVTAYVGRVYWYLFFVVFIVKNRSFKIVSIANHYLFHIFARVWIPRRGNKFPCHRWEAVTIFLILCGVMLKNCFRYGNARKRYRASYNLFLAWSIPQQHVFLSYYTVRAFIPVCAVRAKQKKSTNQKLQPGLVFCHFIPRGVSV